MIVLRFDNVIVCPLLHCFNRKLFVSLAGDHHHRQGIPSFLNLLEHFQSIQYGKTIVQDDGVITRFSKLLQ